MSGESLHGALGLGEFGLTAVEVTSAVNNFIDAFESRVNTTFDPSQLSQEQKEQLGTRGNQVVDLQRTKFCRVLDGGSYSNRAPFYLDHPGECRKECTWGAAYGVNYRGATPSLVCTNEECFTKKADKGREEYQRKLDVRIQQESEKDQALVEHILEKGISRDLADMVATALVSSHNSGFPPADGSDGNRDRDFDYYPGTLKRVVELLHLGESTPWTAFESDEALRALKTAPEAMREEVAAQLLVYSLRQA